MNAAFEGRQLVLEALAELRACADTASLQRMNVQADLQPAEPSPVAVDPAHGTDPESTSPHKRRRLAADETADSTQTSKELALAKTAQRARRFIEQLREVLSTTDCNLSKTKHPVNWVAVERYAHNYEHLNFAFMTQHCCWCRNRLCQLLEGVRRARQTERTSESPSTLSSCSTTSPCSLGSDDRVAGVEHNPSGLATPSTAASQTLMVELRHYEELQLELVQLELLQLELLHELLGPH